MDGYQNNKKTTLSYFQPYIHIKIVIAIIIMLILGAFLVLISFTKSNMIQFYLLREIGKAVIITALVSSTIKWYFGRQFSLIEKEKERFEKEKDLLFQEEVKKQLEILRFNLLSQTREIAEKAICFDAIQAANVDRFYRSRDEASEDIKNSLLRDDIEYIKLIGISLNDFMRDDNEALHAAWMTIRNFIIKDTLPNLDGKLEIQVLIIDPRSQGAFLRGQAEGKEGFDTRLPSDVNDTIRDLLYLEDLASPNIGNNRNNRRVTFSAKVYRTSPILHMIWTPYTVFTQNYHFRPRHSKGHIPIIKYHNSGDLDCIHQELEFHFDWIWDNASIPINEHMNMFCYGIDDAIREANVRNIFYKYSESKSRIIYLIRRTKEILWIKGISLHAFFTHGELYDSIVEACQRGVDVKVLLLKPTSEQAKLRSFREYLISHSDAMLSQFDNDAQSAERLFTDTTGSINFINNQLLRKIKPSSKFEARLFYSSPESFSLITDDEVLVEQYHYGKIIDNSVDSQPDIVLGGDIPVIEYARIRADELKDRKKNPYKIFKDNFDFSFKHCSEGI